MPRLNAIDAAVGARLIGRGAVVAYPTEACFGIGCDPNNPIAVRRIAAIKNRPSGKGFIIIADRFESLAPYLSFDDPSIMKQPLSTWPGPYTWILPASAAAQKLGSAVDGKIAVRVTAHPVAARLCQLAGGAIISTSANSHGNKPIRKYLEVSRVLGPRVDFVVRGTLGKKTRPTQIRDAATGALIRAG